MSNKVLAGILLVALGSVLLFALRWLTGSRDNDTGVGDTRHFMLPHEQPDKAFIEKKLTEGMNDIPAPDSALPEKGYSSDTFFKEADLNDTAPPPDKF